MEDLDLGLEEQPKVKGGGLFITLLVGVTLGVTGTILVPRYLGDYLPGMLRGSEETLEGPVLGKRTEEGRLLLTVQANQGAVLATFRDRVPEIDLLVGVGDTVTLGVARYEPFVEDPDFLGIRKAVPGAALSPEPGASESEAADDGGDSDADGSPLSLPRVDEEEAPADTLD
jgi:hypothetical protein